MSLALPFSESLLKVVAARDPPANCSDSLANPVSVVEDAFIEYFRDSLEPDLEEQASEEALESIAKLVLDEDQPLLDVILMGEALDKFAPSKNFEDDHSN